MNANLRYLTNHRVTVEGTRLFTPEGWQTVLPTLNAMPIEGGCLCLILDTQVDTQNFVAASLTTFTGAERKALRKAIVKARAKREAESKA